VGGVGRRRPQNGLLSSYGSWGGGIKDIGEAGVVLSLLRSLSEQPSRVVFGCHHEAR